MKLTVPNTPPPTTPSFRAGLHINNNANVDPTPSSFPFPTLPSNTTPSVSRPPNSQLYPDDSVLNNFCHPIAPAAANTPIKTLSQSNLNVASSSSSAVKTANYQNVKIPLESDWVFDPIADNNLKLNFAPGSKRDEDWDDHDRELKKGFGVENSYGISLILREAPDPSQANAVVPKSLLVFQNVHHPPVPGTPDSVPQKGLLASTSKYTSNIKSKASYGPASTYSASNGSNNGKKVKFGEDQICLFEKYDDTAAAQDTSEVPGADSYVPFVFPLSSPSTAVLPFAQSTQTLNPPFKQLPVEQPIQQNQQQWQQQAQISSQYNPSWQMTQQLMQEIPQQFQQKLQTQQPQFQSQRLPQQRQFPPQLTPQPLPQQQQFPPQLTQHQQFPPQLTQQFVPQLPPQLTPQPLSHQHFPPQQQSSQLNRNDAPSNSFPPLQSQQNNVQLPESMPNQTISQTSQPGPNLPSTEITKSLKVIEEGDDSPNENDDDDKDEYNDDYESGDDIAANQQPKLEVEEQESAAPTFVPHAPATARPLSGFSRPGAARSTAEAVPSETTTGPKPSMGAGGSPVAADNDALPDQTTVGPENPSEKMQNTNTQEGEEEEYDFNKEFDEADPCFDFEDENAENAEVDASSSKSETPKDPVQKGEAPLVQTVPAMASVTLVQNNFLQTPTPSATTVPPWQNNAALPQPLQFIPQALPPSFRYPPPSQTLQPTQFIPQLNQQLHSNQSSPAISSQSIPPQFNPPVFNTPSFQSSPTTAGRINTTNTLQPTFTPHPPMAQSHSSQPQAMKMPAAAAPSYAAVAPYPTFNNASSTHSFAFNPEKFSKPSSPLMRFGPEGGVDAASEENSSFGKKGHSRGGFNWELLFFRLTNLNNVVQTLEAVLNNDDFYEAAELFISTHDHTALDENGDMEADAANMNEQWVQETSMKLQLLRGWKRFNTNQNDIELLLMSMEEVLGMDQEEIMEDILGAIESKKSVLNNMLIETAYDFIPAFVTSDDFMSYFDSHHSPMKAHNKGLHVDSKSWLGRFQKTVSDMNFPVHLFTAPAVKDGPCPRPFANKIMRSIFGTMCDAPSPREYIDNTTDSNTISNILMSMKEGVDTTSGVVCRTLKSGKVPSLLYIKHLYSWKDPTKLKYSVVVVIDRTKSNADMMLKVAKAIIQSFPVVK